MPPRIVAALVVSVVAVLVLGLAWVVGSRSDSSDGTSTASTATSTAVTTTVAAAPGDTIAPTPITVLPDWYRKGSSRYDERRPATTVPPDRTDNTTTTTAPTATGPDASTGAD